MKNVIPGEEYLTISEVAKLIDVAKYTLIKAIDNDTILIPYTKIKRGKKSRFIYFMKKDVEKFIRVPWRKKNVKHKPDNKPD